MNTVKKSILNALQAFTDKFVNSNKKRIASFLIAFLIMLFFIALPVAAQENTKLANYFLKTPISSTEISELAKWDVVILGMQVQDTNPDIFSLLRTLNPDIKIIAYLSAMEFPQANFNNLESANGPWHVMNQQISPQWFLKNGNGKTHSIWPGNITFNVTKYCPPVAGQKFNNWLPRFVKNTLLATGNWDGIFYDNVLDGIKQTNNGMVDIDNDLKVDNRAWADQAWREGMLELLKNTREILGGSKILLVNSSSYGKDFINGRLYESWPDKWQGGWVGQMNDYVDLEKSIKYLPQIIILNPNTKNTGVPNEQDVRFGLTSSLLGDGYFAYDWGTQDHSQTWWYTMYDLDLGRALNTAYNVLNNQNTSYEAGVWRRDFAKGIVLVNSTQKNQIIKLNEIYKKLSGQSVNEINLAAQDGIILLGKTSAPIISQPVEEVKKEIKTDESKAVLNPDFKPNLENVLYTNGSYVRVFDKRGNLKDMSFYAYDRRFSGGDQIINTDVDNDGSLETVVAGKNEVKIIKANGLILSTIKPFGKNYNSGINLAVGNVSGDARQEILVAPQKGQPIIKVYGINGQELNGGWYAYADNFRNGVKIALGDLNGNGYSEIITGTGFGGGPHVRIFDATGHLFDPGFFPYDKKFRGGVNVMAMDLNGDGKDEIITGAGSTGGPHVRIYDKIGHLVDPGFFAYSPSSRNGVKVSAGDVDGDGEVEILCFK